MHPCPPPSRTPIGLTGIRCTTLWLAVPSKGALFLFCAAPPGAQMRRAKGPDPPTQRPPTTAIRRPVQRSNAAGTAPRAVCALRTAGGERPASGSRFGAKSHSCGTKTSAAGLLGPNGALGFGQKALLRGSLGGRCDRRPLGNGDLDVTGGDRGPLDTGEGGVCTHTHARTRTQTRAQGRGGGTSCARKWERGSSLQHSFSKASLGGPCLLH